MGPTSIAKVIAAGTTADGHLRATVTLSPDGLTGDALAKWPSMILETIRTSHPNPWTLNLAVAVVRIAPDEEACRADTCAAMTGRSFAVPARARAAFEAWNGGGAPKWLDDLWREGFRRDDKKDDKDTALWTALAGALTLSNGGKAIAAGNINNGAQPTLDIDPGTQAPKLVTKAAPEGEAVTIDAVVPSRQSDLAILLEAQRALELCATTRAAHDDIWRGAKEEREAEALARDATRSSLADLGSQTAERYKAAAKKLDEHYTAVSASAPGAPDAPWVFDPALLKLAGTDRAALAAEVHKAIDTHEAATQPQDATDCATWEEFKKNQTTDAKIAGQRFYAIQGSPVLSRLYGLTFDLEISVEEMHSLCNIKPVGKCTSETTVFLLLSVADASLPRRETTPPPPRVWTFAKYRPAAKTVHFWPTSRWELLMTMGSPLPPVLSQFDGVLVLGQGLRVGDKMVDRFVLGSLNVQAASEAALDKRRRPKPTDNYAGVESGPPMLAQRPTDWARKSFSTAGLSLLDRGRLEQAAAQFAARNVHAERSDLFLDAEDLTIGYRVDVAVFARGPHAKQAETVWRSLMARQIEHGTSSIAQNRVRQVVPRLLGAALPNNFSDWGETLDDAVLALPARMIFTGRTQADVYVEETVSTWTGEPMAAHCSGPKSSKVTVMDVGAGDRISLPTSRTRSQRRPPPLRFGRAYRFGVRAVYAGAISLPLQEAVAHYESLSPEAAGRLCLPRRSPADPIMKDSGRTMRRFLRHERIDAPTLLMHRDLVDRPRGAMGYERSAHAIVRTTDDSSPERATPSLTQRIVVPPCVDIHFAALHGVFDHVSEPRQGLMHVRYDAVGGGFPYTSTADPIAGINGRTFEAKRSITDHGNRGDLIYQEGGEVRERPVPYYPDPAVRLYAIAVRYAGTHRYLDHSNHEPFTVEMYPGAAVYPDARVLVLTFVRDAGRRKPGAAPRLGEVLSRSGAGGPPIQHATNVTVTLAPGDDFDIDVWCIPDPAGLAERFALVEAIGTLAQARVPGGGATSLDAFCTALNSLLPDEVCKRVKSCRAEPKPLRWTNQGLGGLPAPPPELLDAIAASLSQTLSARPLDEIAAVQSLRATHATLRPRMPPIFSAARPFSVSRRIEAVLAQKDNIFQSMERVPDAATSLAPVRPEYVLEGDLLVHLATTGSIEMLATTAFPTSTVFDDSFRGRSQRDRRNGKWPEFQGIPLDKADVFGFSVDKAGSVTLPRTQVTLIRWDDLPPRTDVGMSFGSDGRTSLRLEWLGGGNPPKSLGTVKARHIFPDGKARRLDIRIVSTARHEALMRTADSLGQNGRWLREGRDTPPPPVPKEVHASIWLASTVRPAEPVTYTPVPAFVWRVNGGSQTRVAIVRIPLGRGWYSSGEDEKLGIVVWPPNFFSVMPDWFAADQIETQGPVQRRMKLGDFMDEDLGPGGRFITRWGSDPLRPELARPRGSPLHTFIGPSAFHDLDLVTQVGFAATAVPDVEIPLRADGSAIETGNMSATPPSMRAALVAYTPRFDTESEQWYVDAAVEHPFETQPFLRLGLVRYQEHAARDRQVSHPVTQWVQLLPRREVRVTSASTPKGRKVDVVVEGPGDPTLVNGQEPLNQPPDVRRPTMVLRVVREYLNEAGLQCRKVEESKDMAPSVKGNAGLGRDGLQVVWSSTVEIDHGNSGKLERDVKHFAYIEERHEYLPASYRNEPVSADVAKGMNLSDGIRSSPRFSARVQL